ncbi:MAG: SDR family oxidoreductase [Lysobacterales bacterium]
MSTVLITGANRGFGLAMTQRFSAMAHTQVLACCRNPEEAVALKALSKTNPKISIHTLDVSRLNDIENLGKSLGAIPIDILINNAGIFGKNPPATTGFADQVFGNSDYPADWVAPYAVNVIGPMKMVETLVDNVAASEEKKIVVITSVVGSIAGAHGQMFGYAASKAAANMTARNLALALKTRGIIVNPLHPGYAKTDMGGSQAHVEVDDAVDGIMARIDEMTLETSGQFLSYDGSTIPW